MANRLISQLVGLGLYCTNCWKELREVAERKEKGDTFVVLHCPNCGKSLNICWDMHI